MSNSQPIGIFDSGIGGTSIWQEIGSLLPYENFIYLADSKNAPYGKKTSEKIIELSVRNTEFLIQKKCKLVVVACNTATTNSINHLRKTFDIPFIGIEPAIKPAAIQTTTNSVGVLATKGTLSSALFSETSDKFASNVEIVEQVGNGLVELIENGNLYSDEMTQLLHQYLNPMLKQNIDTLVLGCTHYPYLIPQIKKVVGSSIKIIDSGMAVAKQTNSILTKNNLKTESTVQGFHQFYSNSDITVLKNILKGVPFSHSVKQLNF